MDRDALLALAEEVEKATGPDRSIDCWIENYLGLAKFVPDRPAPRGGGWLDKRVEPKSYTASLDAAMTLVPNDAFWRVGHDGEGPDPSLFRADVLQTPGSGLHVARATTPAQAITAAALRALANQESHNG